MEKHNKERFPAQNRKWRIFMKKWKIAVCIISVVGMIGMSGCDIMKKPLIKEPVPQQTATPVPEPTAVPLAANPVPTSTPAPRLIGVKTSTAKYIYLTNHTRVNWREVYVKQSESEDWGKNLIPSESTVKAAEQVQMYYSSQSYESGTLFDMKIITAGGEKYEIYSVDMGDMEKANLIAENGVFALRYMSLSEKVEKTTGEDQQSTTIEDPDTYNAYSNYSDNNAYGYDNAYDNSYNYGYDSNYGTYNYDYNYNYGGYNYDNYDYGNYNYGSYNYGGYNYSGYDYSGYGYSNYNYGVYNYGY